MAKGTGSSNWIWFPLVSSQAFDPNDQIRVYTSFSHPTFQIQSGFYNFIARPLFEEWNRLVQSTLSNTMINILHTNLARWELIIKVRMHHTISRLWRWLFLDSINIYGAWLSFQEEDARGLAAMAESVASHASSSSSSSGGGAGIAASGQGANASDINSR